MRDQMDKPYDILRQHGELWDLFTRQEEYLPRHLDQYGRFPYTDSKHQNILEPRVSEYLLQNGFSIEYPDNKQFAVCLTHDVDHICPPWDHTLLSSLACVRDLDHEGLKKQVFWRVKGEKKSPYNNFKEILELEEKYGATSSFYFLATKTDIRRLRYTIEDFNDELGQITDSGGEVGLHGGYYAYNDPDMIRLEKARLEKVLGRKVSGYRNHYLRFQVPDSWVYLSEAGFEYDSTLGYNERVGFKNGMCHPFRPYNLNTGQEINILELPLTIMDGTLFDRGTSYQEGWELAKRLIDTVASCSGVLTLNWHSNSFNCPFRAAWPGMYEEILKYCHTKNAWMTHGKNIRDWWKVRGF
jgi:peptidoglycan/xylan/chitin deacetylase (PgdA/CDA1 family)